MMDCHGLPGIAMDCLGLALDVHRKLQLWTTLENMKNPKAC
jgi:hypothetical protein